MREDMFKVIVERPRVRYPKRATSVYPRRRLVNRLGPDLEALPTREPLGSGLYAWKRLNENLQPLVRFLQRKRGQPWSVVFAEISEHLSLRSAVKKHVLEHLYDFVITRAFHDDEGTLWLCPRRGPPYRADERFHWAELYVCPKTGLLSEVPRRARERHRPAFPPAHVRVLSSATQLHRVNGVWYELQLSPHPSGTWARDALLGMIAMGDERLRQTYGGGGVYGKSKRQLGKAELSEHGLR